jgi:hypothetical protein
VDLYRTSCHTVRVFGPAHCHRRNRSLFLETEICDFRRDRDCAARSAPLSNPVAQLDYVYSDLRLNYETLKGLISLASLSVAKPTRFETWTRAGASCYGFAHG